ncbi:MAG: glycosyltransferase [Prevotellaceae bacterium]|nr:glycosyltransferase [Prevotellaceae bacterium]
MKYVSLIILNYNNWEDTVNCIESVEKYNTASVKYIVVDNGSTRVGTVNQLNEYFGLKFSGLYYRIDDNYTPPVGIRCQN